MSSALITSIIGLAGAVTALIWNYLHSRNHK
jgi:biopolymer transport protein ExbB/TolQ